MMPNEPFIQQLDMLRENYTRQQKAASALQAALKTVTSVQNRTQKALSDYGDQNSGADIRPAQAAFANARLKEDMVDPLLPELRRELKNLTAAINALKEAAVALQNEPVDVARLDKAIVALQGVQGQDNIDLLTELNREFELAQRALGDEFGQKLRDVLAEQGIGIGGRPPKFEIGRFELDANFARRSIVLRYGKDVVVPRVSTTVDAAVKAYQNASKAIMGRNLDGNAWMTQFFNAYQSARRKGAADNARVNIVDCYVEFVLLNQGRNFFSEPSKRTFRDYSRAEFIHDFYEFANHQRLGHDGTYVKAHGATKSQTDSPGKSMYIVEGDSPYDGRYIADVEFVRD